jgi:hypothetical protein
MPSGARPRVAPFLLVETLHDAERGATARSPFELRLLGEHLAHQGVQRGARLFFGLVAEGHGDDAARLVHDDDMVIEVQDHLLLDHLAAGDVRAGRVLGEDDGGAITQHHAWVVLDRGRVSDRHFAAANRGPRRLPRDAELVFHQPIEALLRADAGQGAKLAPPRRH